MDNDEIRLKIAELKGWTVYARPGAPDEPIVTTGGKWSDWTKVIDFSQYSKFDFRCPNWPENIADAWELVEEIANVVSKLYRWISSKTNS